MRLKVDHKGHFTVEKLAINFFAVQNLALAFAKGRPWSGTRMTLAATSELSAAGFSALLM